MLPFEYLQYGLRGPSNGFRGTLSTDYSVLESGLDRFVRLDKKNNFPGKASVLVEKQKGVSKK